MSLIKLTRKQIEAARRNGAKSCGPKTLEGKACSSMNAFKHGRFAKLAPVLRGENKEAFQTLVQSYVGHFQPAGDPELNLVRQLAATDWRLPRFIAIESRSLDLEIDLQATARQNTGRQPSELDRAASALQALVDRSKLPQFLSDTETRLIIVRQSLLNQLRQTRRYWPPRPNIPQVIELEPLDPEIPPVNEPGTNPQPAVSTGEPDPTGTPDDPESEAA